jgi:hypothetical protein
MRDADGRDRMLLQVLDAVSIAIILLRPRKKGMRLDVMQRRFSAPYPRNPWKKQALKESDDVLRKLLDF